jgi:hypothetical protein
MLIAVNYLPRLAKALTPAGTGDFVICGRITAGNGAGCEFVEFSEHFPLGNRLVIRGGWNSRCGRWGMATAIE